MKRTLALILCALLIVAALSGCGVKDVVQDKLGEVADAAQSALKAEPSLEKILPGTWVYTLNFGKMMEMEKDEEFQKMMEEYGLDLSGITIPMRFTFADGKCTIEITEDDAKQMIEDLKPLFLNMMKTMMEKETGMSLAEVEEYMKTAGMTWDSLVDQALEGLAPSVIANNDEEECSVEDGKIKLGESTWTVKVVSETELQITDIAESGSDSDDDFDFAKLLPMTLKKQ